MPKNLLIQFYDYQRTGSRICPGYFRELFHNIVKNNSQSLRTLFKEKPIAILEPIGIIGADSLFIRKTYGDSITYLQLCYIYKRAEFLDFVMESFSSSKNEKKIVIEQLKFISRHPKVLDFLRRIDSAERGVDGLSLFASGLFWMGMATAISFLIKHFFLEAAAAEKWNHMLGNGCLGGFLLLLTIPVLGFWGACLIDVTKDWFTNMRLQNQVSPMAWRQYYEILRMNHIFSQVVLDEDYGSDEDPEFDEDDGLQLQR